jgi:hypothetical protein
MSGGDKSHVKIVPFGTKPIAPSDYSHIKDYSTSLFALDLGKDRPDPRKKRASTVGGGDGGNDDDSYAEDKYDDDEDSVKPKKSAGKKQTLVDPEDLKAFLEGEGVDPQGENLCPLPKCMEVISKIILNDKNAKVERAEIMIEIEAMNALLAESLKEEERATASLTAVTKEQQGLEHTVETQKEKFKAMEQKLEDLEVEKKTFNGRMGVLERDQRNWGAKLKAAQAKFAKIIWLKPGQTYDEDDGHLHMDIHTIRASTARDLEEISLPAGLDYNQLAGGSVTDFNERKKGPLHFPRYVEDSLNTDSDLMSVATTSRLAFLEKRKRAKGLQHGRPKGGGGRAGTAGKGGGREAGGEEPEEWDDAGSVISALTTSAEESVSPGGTIIRKSSPKRVPHIKKPNELASQRDLKLYLKSRAARAMTRSGDTIERELAAIRTASPLKSRGVLLSSQSVGPGIGATPGDPSTWERESIVTSSMNRTGNKNSASVIGSPVPVRAAQALRSRANLTRGGRSSSPVARRGGGGGGGDGDDLKSVNTMSTLGNDTSIFDLDQHSSVNYDDGGGASLASMTTWEAGGAVGGSLVSSNSKYGKRKDMGRIRVINDGVGTLNYKSRSVKDMLEAQDFN